MAGTTKRLSWAPRAKEDLNNIWRYYARVASPEIAGKIVREIEHTALRLAERPHMGRPREEVWPGLRGVLAQPYTVFYRVTEAAIEVVRVLHERRDFPAVLKKDEL
jgi:toxin ParE1/3/4